MPSPFRPWFQWGFPGDLSTLALEWPMRPWTPADGGVGGSATAASGIPESYRIRVDRIVRMELRIMEEELPFFRAFLNWARRHGSTFTVRLDQDDATTEFTAYLQSPRWEDQQEVEYTRDAEYPWLFIVPLAVRRSSGATINTTWGE